LDLKQGKWKSVSKALILIIVNGGANVSHLAGG